MVMLLYSEKAEAAESLVNTPRKDRNKRVEDIDVFLNHGRGLSGQPFRSKGTKVRTVCTLTV